MASAFSDPTDSPASFNPLVANAGRLEILTALAGEGGAALEFVPLRRRTRLTDGNLASHAKRLQSAGLIEVGKQFRDGKPVTSFTLTAAGRAALESHVRRLVDAVAGATNASAAHSATAVAPSFEPTATTLMSTPAPAASYQSDDDDDDWVD